MTTKKSANGFPFILYRVADFGDYTSVKSKNASSTWRLDDPEYGMYESVETGELCGFMAKRGVPKMFCICGA